MSHDLMTFHLLYKCSARTQAFLDEGKQGAPEERSERRRKLGFMTYMSAGAAEVLTLLGFIYSNLGQEARSCSRSVLQTSEVFNLLRTLGASSANHGHFHRDGWSAEGEVRR